MLLPVTLVLAPGALTPAAANTGGEGGIRVVEGTPAAAAGSLGVRVECASLFSPKSLSTLQSGLSAVVRLEVQLQRVGRARTLMGGGRGEFETVHEIEMAQSISYDVWDERYTVRSPGMVEEFDDLESAEQAASRFAHDYVVAVGELDTEVTYRLQARVQLLPVSPAEGERLAAWLHAQQAADNDAGPSGGRSAGFDVGGLFTMLRGRREKARQRSAWLDCAAFRLTPEGLAHVGQDPGAQNSDAQDSDAQDSDAGPSR